MKPATFQCDSAAAAVLLIAHGSRREGANDETRRIAAELEARGAYRGVVAAFLELAQPDIDTGAARCLDLGAGRVILLPHFLSPGQHVRRDLAAARERLAARYPGVEFRLAEPIGAHPLLLDILRERADAAR